GSLEVRHELHGEAGEVATAVLAGDLMPRTGGRGSARLVSASTFSRRRAMLSHIPRNSLSMSSTLSAGVRPRAAGTVAGLADRLMIPPYAMRAMIGSFSLTQPKEEYTANPVCQILFIAYLTRLARLRARVGSAPSGTISRLSTGAPSRKRISR